MRVYVHVSVFVTVCMGIRGTAVMKVSGVRRAAKQEMHRCSGTAGYLTCVWHAAKEALPHVSHC